LYILATESGKGVSTLTSPRAAVDGLDADLLSLLETEPRISVLEMARRLGIARGTVQARLDRLQSGGVVRGFSPVVDTVALGFPVTAFCTLEIRQGGGHEVVAQHLETIPEVLEAHTITGPGDLLVRVVARSNADLQRVIDAVVADPAVLRTSTVIALQDRIPHRTILLVQAEARRAKAGDERAAVRA
jgi:DNA-binding Lrp family transcriptional regulator